MLVVIILTIGVVPAGIHRLGACSRRQIAQLRADLKELDRLYNSAVTVELADRDKEWFQVFESILGYHPVSMSDALDKGLKLLSGAPGLECRE